MALALAGCSPTAILDNKPKTAIAHAPVITPVGFEADTALAKINNVRRRHFLQTFRADPRLMRAAANHAELMGRIGLFGHEFGPETKFKRRIFAVGFNNSAGENIGVGYRSMDEAIEGWMNSPEHRKIMLKRHYNVSGVAYAPNTSGKNPQYTHFWVMIAGKE